MILNFYLPYCYVLNSASILQSALVLSFYIDVVLTLSNYTPKQFTHVIFFNVNYVHLP